MIKCEKVLAIDNSERNRFYSDKNYKIIDLRDGKTYSECVTPTFVTIDNFMESEEKNLFDEV